jgi:3-dehydroquinate dehydratase
MDFQLACLTTPTPQPVVMSDRDCGGTPDPKTTVALLRRMHALDAVILKIAVMPSDAGDV